MSEFMIAEMEQLWMTTRFRTWLMNAWLKWSEREGHWRWGQWSSWDDRGLGIERNRVFKITTLIKEKWMEKHLFPIPGIPSILLIILICVSLRILGLKWSGHIGTPPPGLEPIFATPLPSHYVSGSLPRECQGLLSTWWGNWFWGYGRVQAPTLAAGACRGWGNTSWGKMCPCYDLDCGKHFPLTVLGFIVGLYRTNGRNGMYVRVKYLCRAGSGF